MTVSRETVENIYKDTQLHATQVAETNSRRFQNLFWSSHQHAAIVKPLSSTEVNPAAHLMTSGIPHGPRVINKSLEEKGGEDEAEC